MKYLALCCAIAILFCGAAFAQSTLDESSIGFRWDANVIDPEGYRLFERGEEPYDYTTPRPTENFPDGNIPYTTVEVRITDVSTPPFVVTKRYWVVRAYDGDLESTDSVEVTFTWDRTAPPIPSNLQASYSRRDEEVTFTWDQSDPDTVKYWEIFYTETSGSDLTNLDTVQNTGQTTPTLNKPITIVPDGERKFLYFTIVAFKDAEVFSEKAVEVGVDINRTILTPPVGFTTFTVVISVE